MDDAAPASIFDEELYGDTARQLRENLKNQGYDGAVLDDIAADYGTGGGASGDIKAFVPFDNSTVKRYSPPQPSDKQRAMQGARRAVQQAAGENISAAPGVARKIAVSPEQSQRNNALFGPVNADRLERMMAITEKDLRDYAQVAPNTGSATALRGIDDDMARGALEALAHAKTGNIASAALAVLRNVGVRDQDAARIVEMAVDPAQTDNLINLLERSYGKQTAAKMGRLLGLPVVNVESRAVGGSR
jgi:hypothetical protein